MNSPLHTIAFDRPLTGVAIVAATHDNSDEPRHTAAELAAAHARGLREGEQQVRATADRELAALRASVQTLQEGLFSKLSGMEQTLQAQMRAALPPLAIEVGRRLLAGYEPSAEVIERVCREALDQLHPEREGLELVVSPHDAAHLQKVLPAWSGHFPDLKLTTDDTLVTGDCLVRSRFGITDARGPARLEALRQELIPVT
ncbi:FliH/SctL family protein [Geminisphaera colitermitum]|uniref:FliH/SctL family protein n=1 Tax=Geminisphaera colitermitum TaxID=1148786 RepID=UPI000158D097|nr:FliH/SctL family protein [Geminisphaera colitermitum]